MGEVVRENLENEKGIYVSVCRGRKLGKDSWRRKMEKQKKGMRGWRGEKWVTYRAVGDKAKERPAEFLECTGGFVLGEAACKGAFVGYESMRVWFPWCAMEISCN